MAVVYIHGVNVRSDRHGIQLEKPFERWFGAKLGGTIDYIPVYWGDLVENQFRWKLASRPRTQLLGMGGEERDPLLNLGAARSAPLGLDMPGLGSEAVDDSVLGAAEPAAPAATHELLRVPPGRRADVIADLYLAVRARDPGAVPGVDLMIADPEMGALAAAADQVAAQWDELVDPEAADPANAAALAEAVEERLNDDGLVAAGPLADVAARAREIASRAFTLPGDIVSTVLGEARPTVNAFVANFLGDVLTYLHSRDCDGIPADIPRRVLDALRRAHAHKQRTGQPIVVVTHSMGGQLFYDAITHYAPAEPGLADLEIDRWFSCGSQVSFFAELGLFRGQDPDVREPQKLQRPAAVAAWTNFYDVNDLVGFSMKGIFDDVEDVEYDTGYGLALAHTGYLARPSFFRAMAARL